MMQLIDLTALQKKIKKNKVNFNGNRLVPIEVHYMEKNPEKFSSKTLISFRLKKE